MRMQDFLIKTSLPIILYSIMLFLRNSNRSLKLDRDLLETMTLLLFKCRPI